MAKGNFGERLKREREMREVSMDELTKATRISARFVEALENEDWGRLPGGIFGHGFVRTIARYLGLNEEALLGEYDLARAEHLAAAPPKPEERIPSPPKWLPVLAVFLLLLLVVGLFYAGRASASSPTTNFFSMPSCLPGRPVTFRLVGSLRSALETPPRCCWN